MRNFVENMRSLAEIEPVSYAELSVDLMRYTLRCREVSGWQSLNYYLLKKKFELCYPDASL